MKWEEARPGTGLPGGPRIALLTRHGKERVLAPVLEPLLGAALQRIDDFDTDTLGSFTRDIPRAGTHIEAARKKARIGMTRAGLARGLGSEGAFGADPFAGLVPWNVEIVVLIDDVLGIEVVGMAQGRAMHLHREVADWPAAAAFARDALFPDHHLVVRADGLDDPCFEKGVAAWDALENAFLRARAHSNSGRVFLESDLRAHANPTRMAMIGRAAEDLAARYRSRCPECGAPGFAVVERQAGLPCSACGMPTREMRAEVLRCPRCAYSESRERTDQTHADPGRCDLCNP